MLMSMPSFTLPLLSKYQFSELHMNPWPVLYDRYEGSE